MTVDEGMLSGTKQALLQALLKNRGEVAKPASAVTASNLVRFTKGRAGSPPFFFFPATDGGVSYFRFLAPYMPDRMAFYGCQAPGFDEEQEPLRTVKDIAEHNLRQIRAIQPHGPYYIGGFCMGGLPSYELACRLQAEGEEVALLLQLMPVFLRPWAHLPGPDALQLRAIEDHAFIFQRLLGIEIKLPMEQISALPESERYGYVMDFVRTAGYLRGQAEERLFRHRMAMYEAGLNAMLQYEPRPDYHGPVDVVVVGKQQWGELQLDMNTPYTVHLRSLPDEQIRYSRLEADSAALFSGSEPDCGLIARKMASYLT